MLDQRAAIGQAKKKESKLGQAEKKIVEHSIARKGLSVRTPDP